jgi:alpha-D-ribose 1-methylphosphonate 5-triphosphate synthase subunit PhnH
MSALAFADPVFESQAAFRAILRAMARPGSVLACGHGLAPPSPLAPAAAAAILALADFETPIWIAPSFAGSEVATYLRFHTGAPLAGAPDKAAFALIEGASDRFNLTDFAQGTPDYPDRSATLVVQTRSLARGARLALSGPGVRRESTLAVEPLPGDFVMQWDANHAAFPLGVDVILAAGEELAALPRSVRVAGGA